jgi:hypothetical protein
MKALSRVNRLTVLDVLEDARDAVQMNGPHTAIKLLPAIIKYRELLPGWGVDLTDNYMAGREKAALLLVRQGVLKDAGIPRDSYGMGSETPIEIIGDEAEIASALRAMKNLFRDNRRRDRKSLLTRSASHLFALLLGAAVIVAVTSAESWRWWTAGAIAVLMLISLRGMPRMERLPRIIVDVATVVGALAAVGAIIVAVFHLEISRPRSTTSVHSVQNAIHLKR